MSSDAVTLPRHRPKTCPFGHDLSPGQRAKIGFTPCECGPAREEPTVAGPAGHYYVWCEACRADHRYTMFYEPPCPKAEGYVEGRSAAGS